MSAGEYVRRETSPAGGEGLDRKASGECQAILAVQSGMALEFEKTRGENASDRKVRMPTWMQGGVYRRRGTDQVSGRAALVRNTPTHC